MRPKVIITGGSGLLALNIAMYKRNEWDIVLFTNKKHIQTNNIVATKVNLCDSSILYNEVETIAPDFIIHTAGLTSVEECEAHQYKAYISNTLTARNIADVAAKLDIKLIHISTDHFSLEKASSQENEIAIPVNNYAKTKLNAEYEVLKNAPKSIIARTNFFGWGHKSRTSFSDVILKALREKKEIDLFTDVFITPISINDLILSLEHLIRVNAAGIFNVVGDERVSKWEFGNTLAHVFDLDTSCIRKSSIRSHKHLTTRPLDMSLSNSKLKEATGIKISSLKASFTLLREEELQGHKQSLDEITISASPSIISYGKQNISDHDIDSVLETLHSPFLTQGPKIQEFEDTVAKYTGANYAVAVSNLTAGLHIACLAANIGPGDKVITSPISFVASSNCAIYCGATPIFADIDSNTLNIDPKEVRKLCTENDNVKAIIPVHFTGSPCDMQQLKSIADEFGAVVIEDAAHGLGGSFASGEKIGSCEESLITGFSFHPVKSITTAEGGILTTNDENIYKQLCRLRSHGINKGHDTFVNTDEAFTNNVPNPWYHEMQQLGYNYRITDVQCALGISQLSRIDSFMNARRAIAIKYDEVFSNLKNASIVQNKQRHISGNHLYPLLVNFEKVGRNRNQLFKDFAKEGINLHVHYIPIPLQPFYQQNHPTDLKTIPNALNYYRQAIILPLHTKLSDDDIDKIISTVTTIIG